MYNPPKLQSPSQKNNLVVQECLGSVLDSWPPHMELCTDRKTGLFDHWWTRSLDFITTFRTHLVSRGTSLSTWKPRCSVKHNEPSAKCTKTIQLWPLTDKKVTSETVQYESWFTCSSITRPRLSIHKKTVVHCETRNQNSWTNLVHWPVNRLGRR